MKKIAFYSFKGGTGRTLLLANTAKFLSQNGKKVFLLDLDLEAPGLIRKFEKNVECGFVDYLHSVLNSKYSKVDFKKFVTQIDDNNIFVFSAGNAFQDNYAQKLAQINWFDLFYKKNQGVFQNRTFAEDFFKRLFIDIKKEYNPDYLLIDSRTGITDVGGMILNELSDEIVSLFLNNTENFEGISRVIKNSIKKGKKIYPVLSRFPSSLSYENEVLKVSEIKSKLFQKITLEDSFTPSTIEISIFHSDVGVEYFEQIKYANEKVLKQSILLQDYMQFFHKLFPEIIKDSEFKHYLNLIELKQQYPNLQKFISNVPYDFIENDDERLKKLKVNNYFTIQTVGPVYFTNTIIASFIQNIISQLEERLGLKENKKEENINWNLLGFQFATGVFDFCKDLYYLDKTRENMVDIWQIGSLSTFIVLINNGQNILNPSSGLMEFLKSQDNLESISITVMGDQAAAVEAYTMLSQISLSENRTLYDRVTVSKNEHEIRKFLSNKNSIAIVDHVTSMKIGNGDFERLEFRFTNDIPVGFIYKKFCPNIRYEISIAIAKVLEGHDAKSKWHEIEYQLLSEYKINAFDWNEIKAHILWDLKLKDAINWNKGI